MAERDPARKQIEQALTWCEHLRTENGYDLHDIEGCLETALSYLAGSPAGLTREQMEVLVRLIDWSAHEWKASRHLLVDAQATFRAALRGPGEDT